MNLLTNAIRDSPGGAPPTVTASAHGGRVELRVIDRGPGIPEADRDLMFAPFVRLDGHANPVGAGLGLALSRGLTEAMQGTLTPEDTPGGGLTMTISLPVGSTDVLRAQTTRRAHTARRERRAQQARRTQQPRRERRAQQARRTQQPRRERRLQQARWTRQPRRGRMACGPLGPGRSWHEARARGGRRAARSFGRCGSTCGHVSSRCTPRQQAQRRCGPLPPSARCRAPRSRPA